MQRTRTRRTAATLVSLAALLLVCSDTASATSIFEKLQTPYYGVTCASPNTRPCTQGNPQFLPQAFVVSGVGSATGSVPPEIGMLPNLVCSASLACRRLCLRIDFMREVKPLMRNC
jgi:hypothetical protein